MKFLAKKNKNKPGREGRNTRRGGESYTFRRSRTLSGSVSSGVKASRAKRPDLESSRAKLHQLHSKKRMLKICLFLSLVLVAIILFLLIHSLAFASVKAPSETLMSAKQKQSIKKTLHIYINNYPAEAFSLTLNESRAADFLQESGHPEVESIKTKINWLRGGDDLEIEFRTPIAVWKASGDNYYVDEHGEVFQHYAGPKPPLQIKDSSRYIAELSQQEAIASEQFMGYVGQLVGTLEHLGVPKVKQVEIPPAPRQLNIYLAGHKFKIKVNTARDPRSQAQDIKQAIKYIKQKNIQPQYLDVRAEGKAFYK